MTKASACRWLARGLAPVPLCWPPLGMSSGRGWPRRRSSVTTRVGLAPRRRWLRRASCSITTAGSAATTSTPPMGTALTVDILKQFPEPNFPGFERNWGHYEMPRLDQPNFSLAMETYKSVNRPETLASTIGLAAGGDVYAAAFSIPVRAH